MNASTLVQELWNCCNVLRGHGMSYGDHAEQFATDSVVDVTPEG